MAGLLSREVATSMRGRALEALVHPFSFREYLRYFGREPLRSVGQLPKAARSALEKDLRTYLTQGGFPESLGAAARDRFELLRSYVDTLHAYLSHLEDAFLIRTVSMSSGSERQRMVNPRKAYPIDMGLIPLPSGDT
jgi:uncharacterized protein